MPEEIEARTIRGGLQIGRGGGNGGRETNRVCLVAWQGQGRGTTSGRGVLCMWRFSSGVLRALGMTRRGGAGTA